MDALIQHMSAAKDMDSARERGREFLTAFERAVTEHARPPVSIGVNQSSLAGTCFPAYKIMAQ